MPLFFTKTHPSLEANQDINCSNQVTLCRPTQTKRVKPLQGDKFVDRF